MNNRNFKKIMLLFVCVLILGACTNEDGIQNPNSENNYKSMSLLSSNGNVANPANPYDVYGYLHNEALDYFFQNRSIGVMSFESYKTEAFSLVADFYTIANPDNIVGSIQDKKAYYYEFETSNYNTPYESRFTSSLAKSLSDDLIFNRIFDNSPNEFLPNTIAPMINSIKQWEARLNNTIQQNPGAIPAEDIKKLFIQSAYLRYSTFYWANDNANPNGILHGNYQEIDKINKSCLCSSWYCRRRRCWSCWFNCRI